MKRIVILTMLILIVPVSLIYGESTMDEIYNRIEKASKANTPIYYRVHIDNDSFEEALSDLPEEILTGKDKPAVVVEFTKGKGVRIVIENIKEEYASLFSIYEDYFKFSGISKVQNPVELAEIIAADSIRLFSEDESKIVLQAWDPEQKEQDDTFALFTLDKKRWVIRKAVYYIDENPYVQAENEYKSYGTYYMPSRIELTNMAENTSDVFIFKSYVFD